VVSARFYRGQDRRNPCLQVSSEKIFGVATLAFGVTPEGDCATDCFLPRHMSKRELGAAVGPMAWARDGQTVHGFVGEETVDWRSRVGFHSSGNGPE
jgi:hypothetical protein